MLTIKNVVPGKIIFGVLLATLLAGCTPAGVRALLQGKKLLDRGRYPEAIEELKIAASLLGTNSAHAWNDLGLAYHYSGQPTNAAPAYQKALALNHDLAEAHYNLGCLWLEQNRLYPAKSELTTYTSLRRNSVEGWLKLGTAQLRSCRLGTGPARSQELAAAEKSFGEALRIDSQNAEALNGLGLAQLQHNPPRPREAAQYFSQALKLQPDYPPALLNQAIAAQVYLNNRPLALQKYSEYLALSSHVQHEEAVRAITRELAQELNPAPPAPVISPSVASRAAAETNLSKPAANVAPRVATLPRTEPATNIARTAPPTIPPAAAPQENVQVVKLSPEPAIKPAQDVASPSGSASAAQPKSAGVSSRAENTAPKAEKSGFFSRLNPLNVLRRDSRTNSNPAVPSTAARGSAESGTPAALSAAPRYAYHSPPRPATGDVDAARRAFAQGVHAQQADHLAEAIQAYRQATRLDPGDYDAYYNLGLAAAAAGSLQQALAAYEFALAIRPDSPDARYNFALTLKKANYIPDAIHELEQLLSTYPNEPRSHLALGNLYAQQLRQPGRAREHYLKVLENDPHNPQAEPIRYWLNAHPP